MANTKFKAADIAEQKIKETTEKANIEIGAIKAELETRSSKYNEAMNIARNTSVVNSADAEKIIDAKAVAEREKEIIGFLEERLEKVEKKALITSEEYGVLMHDIRKEAIEEQKEIAREMIELADRLNTLAEEYKKKGDYIGDLFVRINRELLKTDNRPECFNGELYYFGTSLKANGVYDELKNFVTTGSMR